MQESAIRQGSGSRVSEQSHKTEMAAALRADFERLRARGVESTLPAVDEDESPSPDRAERPEEPGAPAVRTDARGGWVRRALGRR